MYLVDTNVVSELRRPRPHGAVIAWFLANADAPLFLSAVTIGELQTGVELLRDRAKAASIETWLDSIAATFDVLPVDAPVFRAYAKLMHGQPDHLAMDAMIAATAQIRGLTVVTRNQADFHALGAKTLDPFKFRQP